MIAPFAKFIDWSGIQVRVLMMPPVVRVLPGAGQKSQIEEAVQLLKGAELHPCRKPAGAA